jgi:hypothetical protein
MNTGSSKTNGTNQNTGTPAWGQVGSTAYNNMNSQLQTAPINAATTTFANGGMAPAANDAVNTFQGIANNGGTNANIDWAVNALKNNGSQSVDTSTLQGMLGGQGPGSISQNNWQSLFDKSGTPGANEANLSGIASGSQVGHNPYVDDMARQAGQDAANQVNSAYSLAGRYGSGAHNKAVASGVANAENALRYQAYTDDANRQLNASSAISGEQGNRLGLQGNAASGVAGVQGTNIGNSMADNAQKAGIAQTIAGIQSGNLDRSTGAAQGVGSLGQTQLGNTVNAAGNAAQTQNQGFQNIMSMIGALPTIQGNKTYDADKQAQIGSALDQQSQNQLNDLINQFSQFDMQDWARIGGLLSAGTTSAGNWGTQNTTSTQPMNILGAIGSLFSGFSDESIKKNVKKVGQTPGGLDVVRYDLNEKGEKLADEAKEPKGREVNERKPKKGGILGVIAQDVAKKQPNAVVKAPNGLLAVKYGQIR